MGHDASPRKGSMSTCRYRALVKGVPGPLPFLVAFLTSSLGAQATSATAFSARDVFDLEVVIDPEISPDGRRVIFGRMGYDIMKDWRRTAFWIANVDGSGMRELLSYRRKVNAPRWSPD